jgi:hypothetical protein
VFWGRAILSTLSITGFTQDLLLQRKFCHFSLVEIFQRYFEGMHHILSFGWATLLLSSSTSSSASASEPTTKELTKEILHPINHDLANLWRHSSRSTTSASALQTFLSISIINFTLLLIRKDFVCMTDILELLWVLWILPALEEQGILCQDDEQVPVSCKPS